MNYVLIYDPSGPLCISLVHTILIVCSAVAAGYEPPTAPAPTAPAWQGRSIGTSKLRLVEFSAFLEQQRDPDSVSFSFFFFFSVLHRTRPDINPTVSLHLPFLSLPRRLKAFKLGFRHAFSGIIICILANVDDRRGAAEGAFSCVVSPRVCLISSTVQQTPVCAHRTDQPLLQRRPVGVGGHSSDL